MIIDEFKGQYAFLSNFYPCLIHWDAMDYPSVEHAYQASKSDLMLPRLKICKAKTPGEAKRLGQKVDLIPGWEFLKQGIMYQLLELKFCTNPLKQKLIDTRPNVLIEGNNWGDTYWGQVDGKGQNLLGKMLMNIRWHL